MRHVLSDKLFKFSVYELFKLLQYAILCCKSGNYNFLNYNNSSFDLPDLCIHKHTHTEAHTHTRTQMQNQVFNENMRSNKDSGQTERKKLKYLHYLNKVIGKCEMKKVILSEVSCF